MGAFIGFKSNHVGFWTSNRDRDQLLDWFASNRCRPHDKIWEFCKSEGHRWTGCCINLEEVVPPGEKFFANEEEISKAAMELGRTLAQMLIILNKIYKGEWTYTSASKEAKASHWSDKI